VVKSPTTLNLYPSYDGNRLYILAVAVGQESLDLPLDFDSGSAGLILDAHKIFPGTMFDESGVFVFPSEAAFSYNGIAVTNQRGRKEFGGKGGVTVSGFLGYAPVTVGDATASLTTGVVPILFVDSSTAPADAGPIGLGPSEGVFGVDDLADQIATGSAPASLPACSIQTGAPCYVVSALKYLSYSNGLHAGFVLRPSPLKDCAITSSTCLPAPTLTVGLTSSSAEGFYLSDLVCPPTSAELPPYYGPPAIEGYAVCQKSIAGGLITVTGPNGGSFSGPVLFDTGTVSTEVRDTALPSPFTVPSNNSVTLTLPSGFNYHYETAAGVETATLLEPLVNNNQNHVGVGYFESNYFLLDYTDSREGWMLGSP
jgi:hypothetical protein